MLRFIALIFSVAMVHNFVELPLQKRNLLKDFIVPNSYFVYCCFRELGEVKDMYNASSF